MRAARRLLAVLLAAVALPASALNPWELVAGLEVDPVYAERVGQDRPAYGFKGWAGLGPLVITFSSESDRRTTRPVNLRSTASFGAGLRFAPVSWLSADATALVATAHGESTDVNLRSWDGPYVEYISKGLRLHAAIGPRWTHEQFPDFLLPKGSWWRPVLTVTWTRLWARTYGDRFRTWGGDARYLSFGVGIEGGVPLR